MDREENEHSKKGSDFSESSDSLRETNSEFGANLQNHNNNKSENDNREQNSSNESTDSYTVNQRNRKNSSKNSDAQSQKRPDLFGDLRTNRDQLGNFERENSIELETMNKKRPKKQKKQKKGHIRLEEDSYSLSESEEEKKKEAPQSEQFPNEDIPTKEEEDEDKNASKDNIEIVVSSKHKPIPKWSSRTDFLFAVVGFVIGIGNVWRFPALAYSNGGASFLIPYAVMLFLVGIPLVLLELNLGQLFEKTPYYAFRQIHPRLSGIGTASIFITMLSVAYYSVLLAWSLAFIWKSFNKNLPWSDDPEAYFYDDFLDRSDGIQHIGSFRWEIWLGLILVWIFIYFSTFKGIKGTGKVAIFTVTLPFILLIILFFRGITLDGAATGIKFYLKPDFSRLLTPEIWGRATSQILFSLSPCFGILISFGAFLDKDAPVIRYSFFIAILNGLTSFFAGFVVFSILGFMAESTGQDIADVVQAGPELAFIVYPRAVSLMPLVPQLFAVLFFIMLLTLGVDSVFAWMEVVNNSLADTWKFRKLRQEWVVLITSVTVFLISTLFCTSAGLYMLTLFDHYVVLFSLMVIGVAELISIAWIFGAQRFHDEVKKKSGGEIATFWLWLWKYVTPTILIVLLISTFVGEVLSPPEQREGVEYPGWALFLGWFSGFISLAPLVYYCIFPPKPLHNPTEDSKNDEKVQEIPDKENDDSNVPIQLEE